MAEKLETSPSSVSSWALRDAVPGDIIIKCAMETHRSLHWLMTGKEEFEKSNSNDVAELPRFKAKDQVELKGQALYEQVLSSGGKAILERIMQAYGVTKQKELAELLGISTATISTWIRREYFPGDVVVACALDTGINLGWLTFGYTSCNIDKSNERKYHIESYDLIAGRLVRSGWVYLDDDLFKASTQSYFSLITAGSYSWVVDFNTTSIANGLWLIDIEGAIDIYRVLVLTDGRVKLFNRDNEFTCNKNELEVKGMVIMERKKYVFIG